MTRQVGRGPAPEDRVPPGLKIAKIEIAQARDLKVDRLPVWLSRTDSDARHFSQAERRCDPPVGFTLSTSPMQ
jgi:hypothetical protein